MCTIAACVVPGQIFFVSIIMAISCDWQVSLVSRLKHENVVELIGYCLEGPLRLLAYEYATMGSLHDILHGKFLLEPPLC